MQFPSRSVCRALLHASFITTISVSAFAAGDVKVYPACTEGPSESDISAARGAYEAGEVSFHEADYERALLYWEDAFRRDCTAVKLLLNIARAYELSSDLKSAVNALETYVARRPDAPDVSSVEKRIKKLQEHIEQEAAAAAPIVVAEPVREPAAEEPAPVQMSDEESFAKPLWPVFLTGGGAVALIAGVIMVPVGHGIANSDSVNAEKDAIAEEFDCTRDGLNWECNDKASSDSARAAVENISDISRGNAIRTAGFITAGVGLVTAAVGGYFWYSTWRDTSSHSASLPQTILRRTTVTPVAMPGYQGLSISGTF